MDDIQLFNNPEFGSIRVANDENGNVLFCGKDITDALCYTNSSKAIADHCKGVTKRYALTNGGEQEMSFITEGDVYRLICCSQLPKAEKFERWVFDEVLPTINKHGAYLTPDKIEEVLLNPDTIISLATQLKEERAHNLTLSAQNAQKDQIINELKPKADYTDMILHNKGLVTITQIAKDYGMSGEAFNAKLFNMHIQYKLGGQWLLYSKYQGCGYTHSETISFNHSDGRPDVKMNTKWTQKGRLFLYNMLKAEGVLPVIERPEPGTLDGVSPVVIRPNFWSREYADLENA